MTKRIRPASAYHLAQMLRLDPRHHLVPSRHTVWSGEAPPNFILPAGFEPFGSGGRGAWTSDDERAVVRLQADRLVITTYFRSTAYREAIAAIAKESAA